MPRLPKTRTAHSKVPSKSSSKESVALSFKSLKSHRDNHIQETRIDNLLGADDPTTTIIYHKLISVKHSAALAKDNNLESVSEMLAENVVKSIDDPTPLMTYEQWLEVDLSSLSKIVQAMAENLGKV